MQLFSGWQQGLHQLAASHLLAAIFMVGLLAAVTDQEVVGCVMAPAPTPPA